MESEEEGRGSEKRKVLRQRSVDKGKQEKLQKKTLLNNLTKLLKKTGDDLTESDKEFLENHDELVDVIKSKMSDKETKEDRKKEWEDDLLVLRAKCIKLAEAIKKAKRLVVYTGAGISTSANIPDYRGPQGVWTLLDKGKEVAACDLGLAQPTTAHMALFMLYRQGKVSHIVSQNCDGLHLRSGLPRSKLSEVHGNMFIEVCKTCKPVRPYVRLFDVTERTNRYRHGTRRRCYICGSGLVDTIVHFGERGSIAWPINWNGASRAAEKADMILCLGSSLKVLRRYPWLWCMDRPVKQRPPLYIVNLQWTPKDSAATLKLNGRCDFVLAEVLKHLRMKLPEYTPYNDPLLSYATQLHEKEEHTTTRRTLIESRPVGVTQLSMEASVSPTGVITEVRVKDQFTTAKSEFSYMSSERREQERSSRQPADSSTDSSNPPSPALPKNQLKLEHQQKNGHYSKEPCKQESGQQNGFHPAGIEGEDMAATRAGPHSDGEEASRNKKPKLDAVPHSDCDTDSDLEEDMERVTNLLTAGRGSPGLPCGDYPAPFPSPDHNYCISPVKGEAGEVKEERGEVKEEGVEVKEEAVQELVKVEPVEQETPTGRRPSRLRQQKKCRYNELDEEYFLMCQEELLKSAKRDHKKRLENQIKQAIEANEEFKELEYRTVEWDKDALYFSYEPAFQFLDDAEEGEELKEGEFVCECCDPKNRKKPVSSGEMSEEEEQGEEEEQEETDGLLSDSSDGEESPPCRSREESPAPTPGESPAQASPSQGPVAEKAKPLAPGWFGKGRRKRGKVK